MTDSTVVRETPPRPFATPKVKLIAARILVNADLHVFGLNASEDSAIEEHAADLAKCYSRSYDGYELAKKLETTCSWMVSTGMVECLDYMNSAVDREVEILGRAWVEEYDIKPELENGKRILCKSRNRVGIINGVYEYQPARYLVKPESPDEHEAESKCSWIIKFEDAVPEPG